MWSIVAKAALGWLFLITQCVANKTTVVCYEDRSNDPMVWDLQEIRDVCTLGQKILCTCWYETDTKGSSPNMHIIVNGQYVQKSLNGIKLTNQQYGNMTESVDFEAAYQKRHWISIHFVLTNKFCIQGYTNYQCEVEGANEFSERGYYCAHEKRYALELRHNNSDWDEVPNRLRLIQVPPSNSPLRNGMKELSQDEVDAAAYVSPTTEMSEQRQFQLLMSRNDSTMISVPVRTVIIYLIFLIITIIFLIPV